MKSYPASAKNLSLLVALTCLLLPPLFPMKAFCQNKAHILVLHSYHSGLRWTDSESQGILSVLNTRATDFEVHTEYMDTKRISDDKHFSNLFELLKHKYSSVPLKVVICSDDDAFNFSLKYHDALFPQASIVFCGVNYLTDASLKGRRDFVTGVVEAFDVPSTLRIALRLHPKASRVIIINDMTTTGLANRKILDKVVPEFEDKVKFVFFEDLDMSELIEKVASLRKGDIVLLMTFNRDRSGHVFSYGQSIGLISKAALVPIYGVWDFYLGRGIVGGMLTSGFNQGRVAAEMAVKILDGEEVRNIPIVTVSPNKYMFDYQQMKRFGLKLSALPQGSVVINKPASFYENHKGLVRGTLTGIGGLILIIVLLLANLRQRRRAEDALRKSEERFRALYESNPSMYFTVGDQGLVLSVNPFGADQLGYTVQELVGQPFLSILSPEDREEARKQLDACLRNPGEVIHSELRKVHKNGSLLWVREVGRAVRRTDEKLVIYIVCEDITQRKRADEAIAESKNYLDKIINTVADPIFVKDRQHRWVLLNEAFCNLTGLKQEELIGKSDYDFFPGAQAEIFRDKDEVVFDSGMENISEGEITDAKGSTHTIIVKKTLYTDERGEKFIVGIVADITERKKLEDQLRQASKMEAIGTLAGGVAHDFNNLMTAVIGYSDLLLGRAGPSDPMRKDIEQIKRAGERAASLTSQLLAFGRKQMLKPTVLDLNRVVADMEKMLRRLINENINLISIPDPALWHVAADPGLIGQVVMNLVINARDAMPRGGTLSIETANVYLDEDYAHRHVDVKAGPHVMLVVSDTGIGMDEETASHIFEPFFTTKEKGKGTGLGLATVYGIVKQSGGHISVHSKLGHGTTFKICLPRSDRDIQSAGFDTNHGKPTHGESETILLVEDDDGVRSLASHILRMNGYAVLEAHHGEEALRVLDGHTGPVRLLVTDIVMPGMSGQELAIRVEASYPETRVLYISGYNPDGMVTPDALDAPSNFLQKPFTPDALARRVREMLDEQA